MPDVPGRPHPPPALFDPHQVTAPAGLFAPAPDVARWARSLFIDGDHEIVGDELLNEDHRHLLSATIGFVWAGTDNRSKGRRILGTAALGEPSGSDGWGRARNEWIMRSWFGDVPDFVVTLDVHWSAEAGDAEFCALVEHELYHCAQMVDRWGSPKWTADGRPRWMIRGHDVEEFVGVVERYGMDATRTRELVEAARRGPTVGAAELAGACGTCARRAA